MKRYVAIVYDYLNGRQYITSVKCKNENDVRYEAVYKVLKSKEMQNGLQKYLTVTLIYEVIE